MVTDSTKVEVVISSNVRRATAHREEEEEAITTITDR